MKELGSRWQDSPTRSTRASSSLRFGWGTTRGRRSSRTHGDIVWWYTDPSGAENPNDGIARARLSADSQDDVQRPPSGNTLINYASQGLIQEVDANDDVVLEIASSGDTLDYFGYIEFRQSLYGVPLDIQE